MEYGLKDTQDCYVSEMDDYGNKNLEEGPAKPAYNWHDFAVSFR